MTFAEILNLTHSYGVGVYLNQRSEDPDALVVNHWHLMEILRDLNPQPSDSVVSIDFDPDRSPKLAVRGIEHASSDSADELGRWERFLGTELRLEDSAFGRFSPCEIVGACVFEMVYVGHDREEIETFAVFVERRYRAMDAEEQATIRVENEFLAALAKDPELLPDSIEDDERD